MKTIHCPKAAWGKAIDELPRHCWVLVGWDAIAWKQQWFNEVTGEDLEIWFVG